MLFSISFGVELSALLVSIGLGLYLVTRSPHRPEAWLAALTSWSMGGLFLNMLFALSPPPLSGWMVGFLLFWPKGIFVQDPNAWLQGWSSTLSPVFWFHGTMLMNSEPVKRWQRIFIIFAYSLAVVGMTIQSLLPESYNTIQGDPLFINALKASPIYGYSLGILVLFCCLSIWNLILAARSEPRYMPMEQLIILSAATILAGLTGPVGLMAAFLKFSVPMYAIALLICSGLLVTGFGVARYSALMENRVFQWDIFYMFFSIGLITALYMGMSWELSRQEPFPLYYYVFIGVLAIITHSFIDTARQNIDNKLFQHEKRLLREKLHIPDSQTTADHSQELNQLLDNICRMIKPEYAVLLVLKDEKFIQTAAYRWESVTISLPAGPFFTDDFKVLQPGKLPDPLVKAAYLFPLFYNDKQIGALLIGYAEHGLGYSPVEIDGLQEFSDYLGLWLGRELTQQTSQPGLTNQNFPLNRLFSNLQNEISVQVVETGLRNLNNYSRLADLPLAGIDLVRLRTGSNPTHIETGRAIHEVLHEAVELLRPAVSGEVRPNNGVSQRELYPYIILHDAYVNCLPNRKIMDQLYISEGTFNRIRRSAIRSLTYLLIEMESKVPA